MNALLNTADAAAYLGYSADYLKASRKSGKLSGVDAPEFIRIGPRAIRYKREALDNWIKQQEQAGA